MMQKMRHWVNSRGGAWLGAVAGLLWLAMVTVGQAATETTGPGKAVEKPVQRQQLCDPASGTCRVKVECPPIKAPGKAACQTTIDCPAGKLPVKSKQKPKSE